ncbi:MAG: efflux RND transporter periplasmic adaptor subunit [Candidatus Kapaibacterium sp.]
MNKRIWNKTVSLFVGAAIALIAITGCEKEEKASRSMEEIRRDEGVPVSVMEVNYEDFSKKLSFYSNLSGIKESSEYAMISDKIVKINAQVGDYVKEGQVIIEFPTDNPAVQYEQAKIAYENAKKTYERMKSLLEAGETSQQNFDNVETQYLVSKRNYEASRQMVKVDAPISGYIVQMLPKVGDDWGIGKELFTVAQVDRMMAVLWVSETEIGQIRKGMTASIESAGKQYRGTVSQLSMAMEEKTRAFRVEVVFPNPGRELKSGVSAEVNIHTEVLDTAIVLPRNLIQRTADMEYVYMEKDGRAHIRKVTIGMQQGIDVVIKEGLQPGDRVINCCSNLLEDGIKVQVQN